MKSRVSIRLPPSANSFMRTAPGGNSKSPSGCTWIVLLSGRAIQRRFAAPSDQSAALTSNANRPDAASVGVLAFTHPVCESFAGGVALTFASAMHVVLLGRVWRPLGDAGASGVSEVSEGHPRSLSMAGPFPCRSARVPCRPGTSRRARRWRQGALPVSSSRIEVPSLLHAKPMRRYCEDHAACRPCPSTHLRMHQRFWRCVQVSGQAPTGPRKSPP